MATKADYFAVNTTDECLTCVKEPTMRLCKGWPTTVDRWCCDDVEDRVYCQSQGTTTCSDAGPEKVPEDAAYLLCDHLTDECGQSVIWLYNHDKEEILAEHVESGAMCNYEVFADAYDD